MTGYGRQRGNPFYLFILLGLVTTALLHIAASLEWRNPNKTVFTRDTVSNGRFNLLVLAALALTFLVTTLNGLERIFDTTELGGPQWRVCFIAVIAYVVLAEAGKFALRRLRPEWM